MTATEELQGRYAAAVMMTFGMPPVALARGDGCVVWDVDGNAYLDLVAGIAVSALGHAHPAIVQAVTEQAGRLAHTSNLYLHEPQVELAEGLRRQWEWLAASEHRSHPAAMEAAR